MSVLDRLTASPGVYWGEGHGPGGGRFVARVALQRQEDASLTLDYEAWSAQGGLQHAESARLARTDAGVTLAATSNGGDDTMVFREGDPGVFGSVGPQRVGLVITTDEHRLTFSWWWTGRDGELREQSRAVVAPMRQIVPAPPVPGAEPVDEPAPDVEEAQTEDVAEVVEADPAEPAVDPVAEDEPLATDVDDSDGDDGDDDEVPADAPELEPPAATEGAPATGDAVPVPWPGILVLHGPSTGIVAQRLAARLTRAAVVRTDLFDRAVRGTAGKPDPQLRQRIALSVVQGYAATGHPVILHGQSTRSEHEALVAAISGSGLSPVTLVDVEDGEDYGEVARRLIDQD
ncbi:hypothetical protein [Angustibacter peucedani]